MAMQFDQTKPSYFDTFIDLGQSQDSTSLVNVGFPKNIDFFGVSVTSAQPSSWVIYPSVYKFVACTIYVNGDF